MGVKVPKEAAHKYGCIVVASETSQAQHYVEKPESFISDTINGGVYLFDKSIFDEFKKAMDLKQSSMGSESLDGEAQTDELRLEQDVIAPLVESRRLWVYTTPSFWRQIKTAGSCVPANALVLASYKSTNPSLLRHRSPTVIARPPTPQPLGDGRKQMRCEIVDPAFIDETAVIDPSAKIGPNVSIGANVRIGFGCRVKDAIVLDNTVLDQNACVMNSIISEECRIGAWARVEGTPLALDDMGKEKQSITILAKDVQVAKEVLVHRCVKSISHRLYNCSRPCSFSAASFCRIKHWHDRSQTKSYYRYAKIANAARCFFF